MKKIYSTRIHHCIPNQPLRNKTICDTQPSPISSPLHQCQIGLLSSPPTASTTTQLHLLLVLNNNNTLPTKRILTFVWSYLADNWCCNLFWIKHMTHYLPKKILTLFVLPSILVFWCRSCHRLSWHIWTTFKLKRIILFLTASEKSLNKTTWKELKASLY